MTEDRYTHGHHDSVLRSHRWRTAENSAAYLVPHLSDGDTLLDIGCGPGTLTLDLARLVAPGRVVGLDRSAEVISEASELTDSGADVSFVVGDVYALDFDDDSFDVVHAHQVLQHLSDPVAALSEMARVVRPGGLIAVRDADYSAMTWFPDDGRLDRWMGVYQAVARSNRAEPDAGRRLLSWSLEAGLVGAATASVWCFADDESRSWWGGLWRDRVTSSAFADQAVELGLADAAELAHISTGFDDWASRSDSWFIVPHGELLIRT